MYAYEIINVFKESTNIILAVSTSLFLYHWDQEENSLFLFYIYISQSRPFLLYTGGGVSNKVAPLILRKVSPGLILINVQSYNIERKVSS